MTSGREEKRNQKITMCFITRGYELILKLLCVSTGMVQMEHMDRGSWEPGFLL